MKNIFVMFLALMLLAGCGDYQSNLYSRTTPTATSTQAATVTATVSPTMDKPQTPTPKLLPSLEEVCTVTAAEALNLRSGPGTEYTVIHVLKAGETLTRLPTPPAGSWWKVTTTDGRIGYINSKFCTKE